MPYGLYSTLNLFPINVYWIFCRANICVTRLGKQKATEREFVAKCDDYDLFLFFIYLFCVFYWTCCTIDVRPSHSKTSKQENTQTIPIRAHQFGGHLPVPGLTQRTPLKGQLKSNDHRLQDDSSADRLFLMKLDIGLPLTEKSTDSRRPVVEDMEVSFSKYSRLSNGGFQHSEDTYNLLFCARLRSNYRESNICHQQLLVWVSALQNTQQCVPLFRAIKAKTPREETCSFHSCGQP